MTKLKITTLLLALTVVVATGCSNSSNTTPTNSGTATTSEQSSESTDMTTPENSATGGAESTTGTTESTGSTEGTTSSTDKDTSASATANSDLTTKDVAAAIKKQGIKLTSKPEEGWTLNNVKPDRYVTGTDPKEAEPVSIYVFKSKEDLQAGLKDLEKQVNGVPFRKTEYTKGNVLVIYWFEPALNKGSTEKGMLDAKIAKAVESL
ncbi:hypothetical protein [Paenibacillus wenxiniae]|uniref:Lipoprotein n=1 Tax=Paenibacillus wenxiniae TaxID=1636843 RepID=A0ABW4RQS0_9BACL